MKLTKKQAEALGLEVDRPHDRRLSKKTRPVVNKEHAVFDAACKAAGVPVPVREYQFHPTRKWRFDYLFDCDVAVEVQGGLFIQGRHTQGAALINEYEKVNTAQIMGFIVLQVTPKQVENGEMFELVKRVSKEDDNVLLD